MYEIGVLEKEYDRTDPAESTKFEREAAAKLVTFREKLEQENYMRAVCDPSTMNCRACGSWSHLLAVRKAF